MTMDRETVIRLAKDAGLPIAWISETGVIAWAQLERFAGLVLEHGCKPLPGTPRCAIERETTAPLLLEIERLKGDRNKAAMVERNRWMAQIKEDEALMRDVLNAYENGVRMIEAINAIQKRLESKK